MESFLNFFFPSWTIFGIDDARSHKKMALLFGDANLLGPMMDVLKESDYAITLIDEHEEDILLQHLQEIFMALCDGDCFFLYLGAFQKKWNLDLRLEVFLSGFPKRIFLLMVVDFFYRDFVIDLPFCMSKPNERIRAVGCKGYRPEIILLNGSVQSRFHGYLTKLLPSVLQSFHNEECTTRALLRKLHEALHPYGYRELPSIWFTSKSCFRYFL